MQFVKTSISRAVNRVITKGSKKGVAKNIAYANALKCTQMCSKSFWCTLPSGSYIMHPYSLLNVATFFIFRGLNLHQQVRKKNPMLFRGIVSIFATWYFCNSNLWSYPWNFLCPISILHCLTSWSHYTLPIKVRICLFMALFEATKLGSSGFVYVRFTITLIFNDP